MRNLVFSKNKLVPRVVSSNSDSSPSNRLLLLHFRGNNNDTAFVDSSANNRTITRVGSPIISTTQQLFNESTGFFDGSSALTCPSTGISLGTGDFSIQVWVRPASISGYDMILDGYGGSASQWQCGLFDGKPYFYIRNSDNSGAALNLVGSTVLSINTWHYIGWKRVSGTVSAWANGAQDASGNGNFSLSTNSVLTIGKQGNLSDYFYSGYMKELRFSNIAEDLSVVPTAPFP